MSASTMTCHLLDCDRCDQPYQEPDSEGRYHADTAEKIRQWAATGDSWVITKTEDVCDECAKQVAKERHEFLAGPDDFCAWCKEWADDVLHTNAPVPGQLEIQAGGQP